MARKVFFSFHYLPDIFRVNVVRQSNLTHNLDDRDSFFDRSLWEKAKSNSAESLMQLIRNGMAGSSVVCVLAGTETWSRYWVRYEIARAVIEGKGLVTVHINNVVCAGAQSISARGLNPLDYMAVGKHPTNGQYYLCESWNSEWRWYPVFKQPIKPPAFLPEITAGQFQRLSNGTREYDYAKQNGYLNLSGWVEDAAIAVGR
jgi:MTH538 TIR-like domain (DUF1863)